MPEKVPGLLPAIAAGTLVVFYFTWGALHDIAHADPAEYGAEYMWVAICLPLFALLYWNAIRYLTRRAKLAWLIGTGLLVSLFDTAALEAQLHPTYAKDPVLGAWVLTAGAPILALILFHLFREVGNSRLRRTGL